MFLSVGSLIVLFDLRIIMLYYCITLFTVFNVMYRLEWG